MPEDGGEAVTVVVTVPLETLESRLEDNGVVAAELENGAPVSAETARRLSCDALLVAAVLGIGSEVLDIGRLARNPPRPMRRALVTRDRGCAFPGCGRPPCWCHAHHIRQWARGHGATCLDNLVLLCGRHHRVIHHEGWSVRIGADGLPVFRPPRWIDPDQVVFVAGMLIAFIANTAKTVMRSGADKTAGSRHGGRPAERDHEVGPRRPSQAAPRQRARC